MYNLFRPWREEAEERLNVISRKTIRDAQAQHPGASEALSAWLAEAEKADWYTPQDVKQLYPKASVLSDNRVVFNIVGGRYRLLVHIQYQAQIILVKFFGTHRDYDRIDAATYGKPPHQ
jgi:mRNA interferase HigB